MMEIDYEIKESLESVNRSLKMGIDELKEKDKLKRDPYLAGLISILETALGATQADIDRYEEYERETQDDDDPSSPEYGYDTEKMVVGWI